jgi:peptidoglycan/LPS O-acetylase OafA/YrhL
VPPELARARRFELFDALRGCAVLCVVALHIGQESGANANAWYGGVTSQLRVGVAVFFVISAFLLDRPFARAALGAAREPDLRRYALRRSLRILPAYWVALTLLALWPGLRGVFGAEWWVYYGLFQAYRNDWALGGIAPAWSLSTEVAFYALLPALAAALRRIGGKGRPEQRVARALGAIAALGVASLALRVAAWRCGDPHLQTTIAATFAWFAVGIALARVHALCELRALEPAWLEALRRRPGSAWLASLALFVFCVAALPRTFAPGYTLASYALEHAAFGAIAALFALPAIFAEDAPSLPRRVLGQRWLLAVGRISYSLFLWHYPIIAALAQAGACELVPGSRFASLAIAAFPLALAAAWLSHRFAEAPAQRWAR